MKSIKELIRKLNVTVKGGQNIQIKGLSANSKSVTPGDLFIAKKGISSNGAKYIPDAINAGAVAVLTDLYDLNYSHITQLISSDIKNAEKELATAFYDSPSDRLLMIGVTGTNGKTTTAYLIKYLLDKLRGPCGLIGTVEYDVGTRSVPATHTTPDVITNQQLLSQMVGNGCKSAVMEVSSHALVQKRVAGIDYDVSVFTNLSQDHLDYHNTMEEYAAAKGLLFSRMTNTAKDSVGRKFAVVNGDDPYTKLITRGCPAPLFTYGIDSDGDLVANEISFGGVGTNFSVRYQGKGHPCRIPLIGRYNIYNTLAAMGVALTQGYPIEQVVDIVATFPNVPGRMEMVENAHGLRVIVDFAHTDDALENALSCLREMRPERLITVFGCGGDRDRGKRPKMAQVSGKWSDLSIVTSDNPRTEDPLQIIDEIVTGFSEGQEYVIEPDRKCAIKKAIKIATPRDIVVIAGKGHETTQTIASRSVEFDDRKIAREILDHGEDPDCAPNLS